ncbi:MAG: membrane protein insertase YidC [Clostridiales bacterium]|nr:membrane protein insertase YidC [Clostridiales bacterium]
MAFLMSAVDVAAPSGVWEWFILNVFGFISNYGWRVVVFVILLKLVLSPLDFYQRYKMRKNQRITEALKPQLEKLEKQYGNDKEALQRKQMELNKKAGFSYMSACIPLIITLVLFITFYTALRSVSAYMEFKQYVEMYDSYVTAYEDSGFDYTSRVNKNFAFNSGDINYAEIDAWLNKVVKDEETINSYIDSEEISELFAAVTVNNPAKTLMRYKTDYIDQGKSYSDYVSEHRGDTISNKETADFNLAMSILMQVRAQEATVKAFEENRTSFLWIKSLWVADVPWANSVPDWSTFKRTMSSIKKYHYLEWDANPGKVYTDNQTMFNDMADPDGTTNGLTYKIVTAKVRDNSKLYKTNGYLIMVILVVGLSLLSQFITTRQQKQSGQLNQAQAGAGMMKMMMWIMPLMLAAFALSSSSAFTLYMVTNSAMSLIINFITTLIVNLMDGGFKKKNTVVVKHGRLDPNDRINKK